MKTFVVLFDEFGTPTFNEQSESNIFAGISILYPNEEEQGIFDAFKEPLNLKRNKPRKSREISEERAIKIAEIASDKFSHIIFNYFELRSKEFVDTVNDYEKVVSFGRSIFRGVKPRKISQILRSRLLYNCVLKGITNHLKNKSNEQIRYEILMDNWDFSEGDQHIELEDRAISLESNIQKLLNDFGQNVKITIPKIDLLNNNQDRKRLIDGMMSITSRAFFSTNHRRYSDKPFRIIEKSFGNRFECENITDENISYFKKLILEFTTTKL